MNRASFYICLPIIIILTMTIPLYGQSELQITNIHIIVEDEKTHNAIPNATVYVDGKYTGKTSIYGDLLILTSVGIHDIKVTADGYEDKTVSIDVQSDSSYTITLKYKTTNTSYSEQADTILIILMTMIILTVGLAVYSLTKSRGDRRW